MTNHELHEGAGVKSGTRAGRQPH